MLRAQADAESEIALAMVQGQRQLLSQDPDLTEAQKKQRLLELLREENRLLQQNIVLKEADVRNMSLTPEARQLAEKQLQDLRQRSAANELEQRKVGSQNTFAGEFRTAMRDIQDEWGSWAHQMAGAFRNVFEGAIASISNGITGLIMRTKTWNQALQEIGLSILTNIIQAIVQMGVRWVMTQVMMALFGRALMAATVASTVPLAAAATAIWSTPATLATISSYGAAAAAAPGFIAMAEAVTMMQSLARFEKGGMVLGPGTETSDSVLARLSAGEFVVPAARVREWGGGFFDAIRSGELRPGDVAGGRPHVGAVMAQGGGAAPVVNHRTELNLAQFGSQAEAQRWAESQAGETWFHDMMRRSAHQYRRRG